MKKASTPSTASDTVVVQVAAFRDSLNAAVEQRRLAQTARRAYIERTEIPGRGVWFRLRVGPFRSRADADSVVQELRESGYAEAYAVTVRTAPLRGPVVPLSVDTVATPSPRPKAETWFEVSRLTELGTCTNPQWSPRGREIAFFANVEQKGGLYAVGTAAGPILPLVGAGKVVRPTPKFAWSPTAESLAFAGLEEIPWGRRTRLVENLWVVPRQGGRSQQLSRQERYPFEIGRLSWSPSGSWIAFNADFGGEDAHSDRIQDVRLVEVATSRTRKVSTEQTAWLIGWADDNRLLYLQTYDRMSHSRRFGYEVWSYDPRTGSRERLRSGPVVQNCRELAYIASANRLIYSRFSTDPQGLPYVDALVVLDLRTGNERLFVSAEPDDRLSADFAVSPEGNSVAFVRSDTLWLADLAGGTPKKLLAAASQPDWSPDGSDLVCVVDGDLFRVKFTNRP